MSWNGRHGTPKRVDQRVQLPDRRFLGGPAVVPRQHVADCDRQAEREPALDQRAQVLGGGTDGQALRDVVDPALDDQQVGAGDRLVEAGGDLVGALAPDAVVAELELGMSKPGPVLPLPFGVAGARAASPSTASPR